MWLLLCSVIRLVSIIGVVSCGVWIWVLLGCGCRFMFLYSCYSFDVVGCWLVNM